MSHKNHGKTPFKIKINFHENDNRVSDDASLSLVSRGSKAVHPK
jgi:hypothetical protein